MRVPGYRKGAAKRAILRTVTCIGGKGGGSLFKSGRKNFDPLPNYEAQNFMKRLVLALTTLALSSPLFAQITCPDCIYTAVNASSSLNGVTLEIEVLPPVFVGGTQVGGSKHGKCVPSGANCIESRRCRFAMEVTLGGTASPFKYDFCRRATRTSPPPNPWPWDCDPTQTVNAGTVFEEDFLTCGGYGEFRVQISVTSAPPASLPTTLEAVVVAACSGCH